MEHGGKQAGGLGEKRRVAASTGLGDSEGLAVGGLGLGPLPESLAQASDAVERSGQLEAVGTRRAADLEAPHELRLGLGVAAEPQVGHPGGVPNLGFQRRLAVEGGRDLGHRLVE